MRVLLRALVPALAPPAGSGFSVPKAAAFDSQASATRRAQGFKECCYGWCSAAPPEAIKNQPKIK